MSISIIIPVYNSSKYIKMCLDSCFAQTHADIEVVAVNDGSKDNSGEILDRYAVCEPRLKVFHTPNQGVTLARKTAVDNAAGDWLFFLDSDDFIPPTALGDLLKKAETELADLVIGDFNYLDTEHNIIRRQSNALKYGSDAASALRSALKFESTGNLWGRLVHRDTFMQIELPGSDIKIGEDMICGFQLIALSNKVALLGEPIYNYIQYPNSTINSQNPQKVASMLPYLEWVLNYLQEKYPNLQHEADSFVLNEYFAYLMYGGRLSNKPDILAVYKRVDKSTLPAKVKIMFRSYSLCPLAGNIVRWTYWQIKKVK